MGALAIDGPAGAGKSTVARAVASALGWRYVDSGAMYRALALAVLRHGVEPSDEDAVAAVVESVEVDLDGTRVWLDGEDVSDRIRATDVTSVVSTVAAHPRVRAALLDRQRDLAVSADVVMEGRDIGTAVLPDAEVKVYLTAAVDERARRRALEEGLPQDETTLASMVRKLSERDVADATREVAPLARAAGAHEVDTTGLTLDEVVARICAIVEQHRRG
ncbi:MAG TPA: (d)CMP kinase [Actinomycetota bacterium]|nr:(d)CMP kinase [Actinomycetota bacterium]